MLDFLTSFQDIALLFSRIFLGVLFVVHGKGKMLGPKPGVGGFASWLEDQGFFMPTLMAFIAAVVEFWGGIAIILGIFTRLVAVLMAVLILTATYVNVENGKEFKGGWELDLIIFVLCLVLMTFGAGAYGLDAFLGI